MAEELHFARAAERLHMSQSPLSRAIRELERDLGVVLFVRTTRRVELTPAGSLLLERARRALAEIDGAIAEVQRLDRSDEGVLRLGYGPFSGDVVVRIVEALGAGRPELSVRPEQEVTPDSLRRVGAGELAAAVVMESPSAARRHGVRVDTLRDEPLVAALPKSHRYASEATIPIGEFVAEPVLLPREPTGQVFNAWLRSVIRAHGFELEQGSGAIVDVASVNSFFQPDAATVDYGAAKAKAVGTDAETIRETAMAAIATGRFTTPREVATLVTMLASDRMANVTGVNYVIDGGLIKTT